MSSRIIKTIFKVLALVIGLCPTSAVFANDSSSNITIALEEIERIDWCKRLVADFDHDGIDEFINQGCTHQRDCVFYDLDSGLPAAKWHLEFPKEEILRFEALDITGDEKLEVLLSMRLKDKAWIMVFDCERQFLKKTESIALQENFKDGKWDGQIGHFGTIDVNGDGHKDILADVWAGRDLKPRGLFAFDWKTGKKLWSFLTGPNPDKIITIDLDGDSVEDILFNTWAPDNGNTAGDMDDGHSYLVALNRIGNLLWKRQVSGRFYGGNFAVEDIDRDGEVEIIHDYNTGSEIDPNTKWGIQILSGRTGRIKKYIAFSKMCKFLGLADLNRDGNKEIIAATVDGVMMVLDKELNILPLKHEGNFPCGPVEVQDINHDGELEIIAHGGNILEILDHKLKLIGKHTFPERIGYVKYLRNPKQNGLLSVRVGRPPRSQFLLLKFAEPKGTTITLMSAKLSSVIYFLAGAIVGILLLFAYRGLHNRVRRSSSARKDTSAAREGLLSSLSAFGHGKLPTANLNRLTLLFKNLPEDPTTFNEYVKRIKDTVNVFREYTSPALQNIEERAVKAEITKEKVESFHRHLQEIKTLITQLETQNFSFGKVKDVGQKIATLADDLEGDVKTIQEELYPYFSCDVLGVVQKVLSASSARMSEENIAFTGLMVKGNIAGHGFIQQSELSTIVEDLISNAISAMKEREVKEISVGITFGERKIGIALSDTGCGIPKENISKIFARDFSTKEEGGFGLYYAKNTLAKYGGTIKVQKSEVGKGTTMLVEVKKV